MKKIFLILLLVMPCSIFAYENDNFEISIPEDMIENINDTRYKWHASNDEELPNITIVQSENKGYNIDLFDDADVKDYEEFIEDELNKELEEFDIDIDAFDSKIASINDRTSLVYKTKWDTMESYGYDTYQIVYVFTTKNYLTTVTFTAKSEEEINSEEFKNTIESFVIKDEDIERDNTDLFILIGFATLGGIIGLVISFIIKRKGK